MGNRVAASEKQEIGQDDGTLEANMNDKSAQHFKDPGVNMVLSFAVFSTEYRMIYAMFFGNSIAGLVFLSRLANIVKDIFGKDEAVAATIVAINGDSTWEDGCSSPRFLIVWAARIRSLSCCAPRSLSPLPIIMEKRAYWALDLDSMLW